MFKKVSKNKSLVFLFALRGALSRGLSLEIAVEMLSKIQPKPINTYLSQIIFLVRKKNKKIFELLEQYGFITNEEKIVFEKAKDTKFALQKVLEMRKIQDNFSRVFLKMFIFPFVALIFTPLLTYWVLNTFSSAMGAIFVMLENKGIKVTFDDLGLPSFYYFVWDKSILIKISVISAIIAVIFYGSYFYFKRYKPRILYKILPPTAYDDLPYLLSYMSVLNKVGFPIKKVAEILAKSNLKPGWHMFFKDLEKRVKNGESIYFAFKKENFPNEIVTYIKYDELNGDFWANIDNLRELTIMRNKDITEMFTSQIKPYVVLISWGIIIFFLSGIMLYSFSINNLTSLMQG